MYFEQTQKQPERFALQDISREEAEMLVQAIIALKESKFMDPEEFADERRKLLHWYVQMNTELVNTKANKQILAGTRLEHVGRFIKQHANANSKPNQLKCRYHEQAEE